MVYRVRKQLVEEGFEAVLSRKQRATPAVARIFDNQTHCLGLFQAYPGQISGWGSQAAESMIQAWDGSAHP
jgi:hypothetical protein